MSGSDASGIVVITQIQPISVIFTLPETYVGELIAAKAAGAVALEASVGGKTVGTGVLDVIDNRIDQNTGTVRMKGTFPNEALGLWPGQFVNVRLHLKTLPDATVVPSAAVQQGASGRFVYRVEPDSTVKLVTVEVAQEGEDQTVIGKGVQAGEKVATSGFSNLQDGSKVAVADPNAPAATPAGEPQTSERRQRRRNRDGQSGEGARSGRARAGRQRSAAGRPRHNRLRIGSQRGAARRRAGAMSVSSPFIARPVATSLLAVAVLLGSALAYFKLPISSLPQVDFPVITVTTQLPGASADTMAALVTSPLERQLGQITALTIDGLDQLARPEPGDAAIRARPRHQRRRPGCAVRHQRGRGRSAGRPALSADLR